MALFSWLSCTLGAWSEECQIDCLSSSLILSSGCSLQWRVSVRFIAFVLLTRYILYMGVQPALKNIRWIAFSSWLSCTLSVQLEVKKVSNWLLCPLVLILYTGCSGAVHSFVPREASAIPICATILQLPQHNWRINYHVLVRIRSIAMMIYWKMPLKESFLDGVGGVHLMWQSLPGTRDAVMFVLNFSVKWGGRRGRDLKETHWFWKVLCIMWPLALVTHFHYKNLTVRMEFLLVVGCLLLCLQWMFGQSPKQSWSLAASYFFAFVFIWS